MTIREFAQTWSSIIATVLGVLVGAAVAGGSAWRARRRERERAIATALADLLEARHHAKAARTVLRTLRQKVEVPSDVLPLIPMLLDSMAPDGTNMHARYDAAISQLAAIDPILAFEMRSKDTLPTMLRAMRTQLTQLNAPPDALEHLEEIVLSTTLPAIEEALRILAKEHSGKTLRLLNEYLARPPDGPPELAAALDAWFAKAGAPRNEST